MLRPDVVQAAKDGAFQILGIRTIQEGIEVLTGVPAGDPDGEGRFPPESVFGRVDARLRSFSATLRVYSSGEGEGTRRSNEIKKA
jgi:Lon-like ATP-dependent protease